MLQRIVGIIIVIAVGAMGLPLPLQRIGVLGSDMCEKGHPKNCPTKEWVAEMQYCKEDEHQAQHIPRNSSIAILLHGNAFRNMRPKCTPIYSNKCKLECNEGGRHATFGAADSLMKTVNELKKYDNTVDLFVVSGHCKLVPSLIDHYQNSGSFRQVHHAYYDAKDQGDGVYHAIDNYLGISSSVNLTHDVFILTRPDLALKRSVLTSRALDFHKLNFASSCEAWTTKGPLCVFDQFITMPQSFLASFREAKCFQTGSGHMCRANAKLKQAITAAGIEEGFVFWKSPGVCVRCDNCWYNLN
jgi:hypothetical protein